MIALLLLLNPQCSEGCSCAASEWGKHRMDPKAVVRPQPLLFFLIAAFWACRARFIRVALTVPPQGATRCRRPVHAAPVATAPRVGAL